MKTKICKKCGIEKNIDNFRSKFEKRFNKNYLYSYCKECEKVFSQKYRLENKERFKEYHKIYNQKYNSNKEYHKQYSEQYYKKNKKVLNKRTVEYKNKKKKENPIYRLKEQIRTLIWISFNGKGYSKSKHTEEILGCKLDYFYNYLLQTFKDNYGYKWDEKEPIHIDHIIPLAKAKTEEDIIKLCHYTNLQLLKAEDNLHKSNKLNWKLSK